VALVLRLARALIGGRAGLFGEHAKARAGHVALLAAFGTAAFVFLIILATLGLKSVIGLIPALAVMAGVSAFGAGIVLMLMRAEQRQHERALAIQAERERRLAQTALIAAIPTLKRGGVLAAALGVLAFVLMTGRGGDDGDGDAGGSS
jgi:cobalamin synthase